MWQTLEMARLCKATWVFCGDMKGPKSVWPVEALNGCISVLAAYSDVRKIGLPGNHDLVETPFGSGLEPLREYVTVFDRPTLEELRNTGIWIAAWPWGAGHREELPAFLDEAAAARKRGETVVLLAHLMFEGMFPQADAQHPGKSLPPEAFRPGEVFDLALVGDVHRGQVLLAPSKLRETRVWKPFSDYAARVAPGPGKARQKAQVGPGRAEAGGAAIPLRAPGPWRGEVFYPGSPYAQSFGERDDGPKGCLLVDVATGQVDLLPVRAPRFCELAVETVEGLEGLAAHAADAEHWRDGVVRLIVPAAVLAKKGAADFVARIKKASGARLLFPIPRHDVVAVRRAPVHGGMTPQELVRTYAETRPLEGADRVVVERAGLELLVEKDEGDDRV